MFCYIIVHTHVPPAGRSEDANEKLWDEMLLPISELSLSLVVGDDCNDHVDKHVQGYEGVHVTHGYGAMNTEGERKLELGNGRAL